MGRFERPIEPQTDDVSPAGGAGVAEAACPWRCYIRRVVHLLVLLAAGLGAGVTNAQSVETQRVVSISSSQIRGGIVAELTWVGGVLTVQGVFLEPSGEIKAEYFIVPADGTELRRLTGPTAPARSTGGGRRAARVRPGWAGSSPEPTRRCPTSASAPSIADSGTR
jgi:hypothetical protein